MQELKNVFWLHVILVPIGVCIIADDAAHPERWEEDWYRNPAYAIPGWIIAEAVVVGLGYCVWRQERRKGRIAEGIRLLKEAIRLQAEGNHQVAEAAYQEGVRLTGLKRH